MKGLDFEPKWFMVILFTLAGVFLGALGLFVWLFNGNQVFGLQKIHPASPNYRFINPLLAVDTTEKKQFLENKDIEAKVSNLIKNAQTNGDIKQGALYFRDLEAGHWVGVNQDLKFAAGKILKLPIAIAYFQAAQNDPEVLDKKLPYHPAIVLGPSADSLVNGQVYTVEELIEAMVVKDDDAAAETLFDNVDKIALKEVYSDLGIDFPEDKETQDFISIKGLALFIRILYNATYLNRTYSEKVLTILSQTDLRDGLALGLPNNVDIAHRYHAETVDVGSKADVESHSCGIIYYPSHPYLLCMMGIGQNIQAINNLFKDISFLLYNEIASQYNR